jgi:3D-(3,5/4)-trihydroxycyclohexane-1,2-dione acylhydrolase (decyclizing)
MGYEIAGGLGVKLADPAREVFILVGDGSYLMMAQEIATAVQERVKLIIVLVDNGGFASIGALSESVGAGRLGTEYRYRQADGDGEGEPLRLDLPATAAGLGALVIRAATTEELEDALIRARAATTTTVVSVRTDQAPSAPSSGAWWDVPVASVALDASTRSARAAYDEQKLLQRPYLRTSASPSERTR